jgi:hypothetical protein
VFGRKRGVFDGGEIFIRFETLTRDEAFGIVALIAGKWRAGPELAGGRAAERSDLAGPAAHDYAMAVIIRGASVGIDARLIGERIARLAARSYSIRADDPRLIETVDERPVLSAEIPTCFARTIILVVLIFVHFYS